MGFNLSFFKIIELGRFLFFSYEPIIGSFHHLLFTTGHLYN